MSKTPELGQFVFGNPSGDYGMPEYADAFLAYILDEIERVYGNDEQSEWLRYEDPGIPGITFRPYWWGDEDAEGAALPNFVSEADPKQEIRWYKHPGRGTSCTIEWSEKQWADWFDRTLEIIRKAEED